jgi:hypothetical protein
VRCKLVAPLDHQAAKTRSLLRWLGIHTKAIDSIGSVGALLTIAWNWSAPRIDG